MARGIALFPLGIPLQIRADLCVFSWLRYIGRARLCDGNCIGETCKVIFLTPIFQKVCCESKFRVETSINISISYGSLEFYRI